jgi:uncharacterized protein
MTRLFLILVIVLLAILLWRSLNKKIKTQAKTKGPIARDMIRCDYCGLHVPEDTILRRHGRHYCSKEHMLIDNNR